MTHVVDTELLRTPFVASWFHRARPGDVLDPDTARRSAAWAHWALTAMTARTGHADRPYTALTLPGKFYSPRGHAPTGAPHLEIPAGMFERPDPLFPDRLAQAGNGLHFPWWIVPEVLAAKRTILTPRGGDISPLVDVLTTRQAALIDALKPLATAAANKWQTIEELQVADPTALSATATAPFTTDDISAYLPAAAELDLRITFDTKLAQTSRGWASRRLGVWRLTGTTDHGTFTLGVLTPRLTRSSLFTDPMFAPHTEAPAALLVRGLILRRLLATHLGTATHTRVADPTQPAPRPRLRSVVARLGDKDPQATPAAAVGFLHTYPDPDDAWTALENWANTPVGPDRTRRAVLSVTPEAHRRAHRAAQRAVRRAEEPTQEDIDVLLPLAWDHRNRVVRVTFTRPAGTS